MNYFTKNYIIMQEKENFLSLFLRHDFNFLLAKYLRI